jgi:chromosome condensin MukBEF ATPase and DNA-binding subunit MukB
MAKSNAKAGKTKSAPAKKKPVIKLGDPLDTFEKIETEFHELEDQLTEFRNGKKVAVSRARKAANELRKLLGLFRKEIQAAKANM